LYFGTIAGDRRQAQNLIAVIDANDLDANDLDANDLDTNDLDTNNLRTFSRTSRYS
jgi:hypothetical protein